MEPRFSADIAGDAPLTFASAKASPYAPLCAWLDRLSSLSGQPGPAPLLRVAQSPPEDRRSLRLHLSHAIKNNTSSDPVWDEVYPVLAAHAGSLVGNMDTGVERRSGPAWIDALFADRLTGTGLTALRTDFARVSLLASALADPSISPEAWLDRAFTLPALSPLGEVHDGYWMLGLLDIWQTQGLTVNNGPAERMETLIKTQQCVLGLDALLALHSPGEPVFWRHAARQVECRLAAITGAPPLLPVIPDFPIHMASQSQWSHVKINGAIWRTPVCLMLDWIRHEITLPATIRKRELNDANVSPKPVYPQGVFDPIFQNPSRSQQLFDHLAGMIHAAPSDLRPTIRQNFQRFGLFLTNAGLKPLAAQFDRVLLDGFTAPAVASSRASRRL